MSEEQNLLNERKVELEEKKEGKCCKGLVVAVVASLLFSIAAFGLSVYNMVGAGFGGGEKKVVISTQYDKGQSYEKAQKKEKPIVVFFYTDWCGFCQRFAPTFGKLTKDKEIKKNYAIAYVNCENQDNRKLMEDFEIQGFPTVYVIKDGKRTQLENGTFFGPDAVKVLKDKMLELIK